MFSNTGVYIVIINAILYKFILQWSASYLTRFLSTFNVIIFNEFIMLLNLHEYCTLMTISVEHKFFKSVLFIF